MEEKKKLTTKKVVNKKPIKRDNIRKNEVVKSDTNYDDKKSLIIRKRRNFKIWNIITLSVAVIALASSVTFGVINLVNNNKLSKKLDEVSTLVNKIKTDIYGEDIEYDVSAFEEITPKDLKDLSKDKKILVFLGRSTCRYCAYYAPVLTQAEKDYHLEIKYIDISKLLDYQGITEDGFIDKEASDILTNMKMTDEVKSIMADYGATPMLLEIENNKMINASVGYLEQAALYEYLDSIGYSK